MLHVDGRVDRAHVAGRAVHGELDRAQEVELRVQEVGGEEVRGVLALRLWCPRVLLASDFLEVEVALVDAPRPADELHHAHAGEVDRGLTRHPVVEGVVAAVGGADEHENVRGVTPSAEEGFAEQLSVQQTGVLLGIADFGRVESEHLAHDAGGVRRVGGQRLHRDGSTIGRVDVVRRRHVDHVANEVI